MAPRRRRFIIFNNPPSAATVKNHDTWADTSFTWLKLPIPNSPSPEPDPADGGQDEAEPEAGPSATPDNPDQPIPSPPSVLLRRLAAIDDGADATAAVDEEGHSLSQSQFRDPPSRLALALAPNAGRAELPASSAPSPTSSVLMPPPPRQPRQSVAKRTRGSGLVEDEGRSRAGRGGVYAHNLWGEAEEESYAVWEREATEAGSGARADETVEDSFEGSTQLQGTQLLPAPSASAATASQPPYLSRRPLHPRQSSSNILAGLHAPDPQTPNHFHLQDSTFSTTSDATSDQSGLTASASAPALPPHLPWDHFAVRDLLGVRAGLARSGGKGSVRASVLGLVVEVAELREVGERGNRRAGFEVEDESGGRVSVVLWEEWVGSWHGVVRRGDVVFLGDLKLNLYASKLQAQPTHAPLSRAQICWRLVQLDPEDAGYGFAARWRESSPEAERVMRVVEWAGVAYRGVFEGTRKYG